MRINTILVASMATVAVGVTAQSCVALATSTIGIAVLKKVLLGGITKGLNIFGNKNSFMSNQLIDAATPRELRNINNTLENIGLGHLVHKEKEYIAEAAAFTVDISRPILVNAVNSLTKEDVARIVQGGSGTATQILKEKTADQLVLAISPRVDSKLNEFGLVQSLNSALAGSNVLGSLLGGQNSGNLVSGTISKLAAEQMVNGLFNIIENHEKQNSTAINDALTTR